jgi:cell division protein FtsQ
VEVAEHVPVALVVLNDLYLLNEDGKPFKRLQPEDGLDLPLVTGVDREAYLADGAKAHESLLKALAMVAAYTSERSGKSERLSEVRVAGDGLVLMLSDGTQVRMGEGATEEKLQRLGRVREGLKGKGLSAEVIHLDNRARPGWVAVKISSPVSERNGTSAQ